MSKYNRVSIGLVVLFTRLLFNIFFYFYASSTLMCFIQSNKASTFKHFIKVLHCCLKIRYIRILHEISFILDYKIYKYVILV